MTDILERLRETRTGKTTSPDWPYGLLLDAADEIEGLRNDVDFLLFLLEIGGDNDNPTDADDTNGHPEGAS
jgi:hypothetical protein